jgi:hypothetical protein
VGPPVLRHLLDARSQSLDVDALDRGRPSQLVLHFGQPGLALCDGLVHLLDVTPGQRGDQAADLRAEALGLGPKRRGVPLGAALLLQDLPELLHDERPSQRLLERVEERPLRELHRQAPRVGALLLPEKMAVGAEQELPALLVK